MIDHICTLSARLVTRYLQCPRVLLVRARAWLAAETDDLAKQMHCLKAIVALDPDLDWRRGNGAAEGTYLRASNAFASFL